MIFSIAWLAGCDRESPGTTDDSIIVIDGNLEDGSITIIDHPDVEIKQKDEELMPVPTEPWLSISRKKLGIKAVTDDETQLRGNEYRFKLVAEMDPLRIDEYPGFETQATDVKITDDGYAFVSYNDRGDPHRGGVVVYKYTVTDGTLDNAKVDVQIVTGIQMPNAEISAIEYYNNKLYMIGASSEPKFGYNEEKDGFNYAFLLVMDMNTNKTFNRNATPKIVKLSSFQGTSIRVRNERIYITTGDGTHGTKGGLYILRTSDYSLVKFNEKDHARSVDMDAANIYLMQAEPERVFKYDLNGDNETALYITTDESMQPEAKSEILVWKKYLFLAENESGLRMLFKENGEVNHAIDRPGEDENKHVTNSVCMNSDPKKNAYGDVVESDLLFVANGEKGIYWYDIVTDVKGKDWIVACGDRNSLLGENGMSANFISSKGNIVFVADGLGGLKVLYLGEEPKEEITVPGCPDDAIFRFETFIKDNGNSKIPPPGLPLDRKVGDLFFQVEGNNLVVYLRATAPPYKINGAGVLFGSSPEDLEKRAKEINGGNLFTGSGDYKDKNINNGTMTNMNEAYRTILSDGIVKFVFPREVLPNNGEGNLLCIVYGAIGWGYGDPYGPGGQAGGNGVHNNGQIIVLEGVTFCDN